MCDGDIGDFFESVGDEFNNFFDSGIGQVVAPLAGAVLGTLLLPGVGTALGMQIGGGLGGAIGGGLGSLGGTLAGGHNPTDPGSLLKAGMSSLGGYYAGPGITGVAGLGGAGAGLGSTAAEIAKTAGDEALAWGYVPSTLEEITGAMASAGLDPMTGGALATGLGSTAADIFGAGLGDANAWGYAPSTLQDITSAMANTGLNPLAGGAAGGGLSGLAGSLLSGATPYLLGGGLLSNLLGKQQQAEQQKRNLADYLGQTTWTPDRINRYLASIGSNTAGTLGRSAQKAKGTLAEQLASSGRGGGSYGAVSNAIEQNLLNELAQERNKALATVSIPSSVSPAPFMAQTDATGESLLGLGGLLGNLASNFMTADLLKQLALLRL